MLPSHFSILKFQTHLFLRLGRICFLSPRRQYPDCTFICRQLSPSIYVLYHSYALSLFVCPENLHCIHYNDKFDPYVQFQCTLSIKTVSGLLMCHVNSNCFFSFLFMVLPVFHMYCVTCQPITLLAQCSSMSQMSILQSIKVSETATLASGCTKNLFTPIPMQGRGLVC